MRPFFFSLYYHFSMFDPKDPITAYGFTAVPRDLAVLLDSRPDDQKLPPGDFSIEHGDLPIPETKLAKSVLEYARRELPEETLNHCFRVYCWGMIHLFSLQTRI